MLMDKEEYDIYSKLFEQMSQLSIQLTQINGVINDLPEIREKVQQHEVFVEAQRRHKRDRKEVWRSVREWGAWLLAAVSLGVTYWDGRHPPK